MTTKRTWRSSLVKRLCRNLLTTNASNVPQNVLVKLIGLTRIWCKESLSLSIAHGQELHNIVLYTFKLAIAPALSNWMILAGQAPRRQLAQNVQNKSRRNDLDKRVICGVQDWMVENVQVNGFIKY